MRKVVVVPPAVEPVSIFEVMSYCRIDESSQEPAPGAITAALGSGAGNVDNGTHRYLCTFVTADGETQAGAVSNAITIVNKAVTGKIVLTDIPTGSSHVTFRRIYRTAANGSTYLLLTTIPDNSTTTYTDNLADSSLGTQAPTSNTTGSFLLSLLIQSARQAAETQLKRYLITQTVDVYFNTFEQVRLFPFQSVESINYIDAYGENQVFSEDDYVFDNSLYTIEPIDAWPVAYLQTHAVKVRVIAGYGDTAASVPACIRNWMLLRIKQLYDNRDPVNTGNGATEFPYSYVDGLLDSERIYGV